jgi:hypothetical protein
MNRELDLQSEEFGPLGNITGQGASRTLGRPSLPLLQVLVRETVQNSIDAAQRDSKLIDFRISTETKSGTDLRKIRTLFAAAEHRAELPLAELFSSNSITTLTLSDRGTYGLDGPTRANDHSGSERRNFVNFFRNIGQAGISAGKGGTYGYGKSVLFVASRLSTILVYTRVKSSAGPRTRLMGMTLCPSDEAADPENEKFTGRHWWGSKSPDEIVEPLLSSEADDIALSIGFVSFDEEFGTQVMILEPQLESADLEKVTAHLLSYALLYAWPWTCGLGRTSTRLRLSGLVNGREMATPTIEEYAGLTEMADALRHLVADEVTDSSAGSGIFDINCGAPKKALGKLAIRRFFRAEKPSLPDVAFSQPEQRTSRHIAWMRDARLVVKYAEGPEPPSPDVEYAGVFCTDADPEVEQAFTDAEPPTHDDWSPDFVRVKQHQTFVRVGVRRIKEQVQEFVEPRRTTTADSSGESSAWFASGLASLLPSTPGERPGLAAGNGSTSRSASAPRPRNPLEFSGDQAWEWHRGEPRVTLRYTKSGGAIQSPKVVMARLSTLVGDGAEVENEPPIMAVSPEIIGWRDSDGLYVSTSGRIDIERILGDSIWLVVAAPADSAVTVQLRFEAAD